MIAALLQYDYVNPAQLLRKQAQQKGLFHKFVQTYKYVFNRFDSQVKIIDVFQVSLLFDRRLSHS